MLACGRKRLSDSPLVNRAILSLPRASLSDFQLEGGGPGKAKRLPRACQARHPAGVHSVKDKMTRTSAAIY